MRYRLYPCIDCRGIPTNFSNNNKITSLPVRSLYKYNFHSYSRLALPFLLPNGLGIAYFFILDKIPEYYL